MIGAIAGDVIGSIYEAWPVKSKDFELFKAECHFTDDTVLTVAVAESLLKDIPYVDSLHEYFHRYPGAGYGGTFSRWAAGRNKKPYNSWGNGSAMRVSPVGFALDDLDKVLEEAKKSAEISHNHPEGIKGAQAVAASIFLARTGSDKESIRSFVTETFEYDLSMSIDRIRDAYRFDVSCQGSVPQSILSFLESTDFEDAIRNAISLGGDADTMACIAGSIAEAYYGVPGHIRARTMEYLDDSLISVIDEFYGEYMNQADRYAES